MSNFTRNATPIRTIVGLIKETRPRQWYKQGVLLVGLVFSENLLNTTAVGQELIAMFAFTAAAGATYIVNDVSDIEEDRKHPRKRYRPIASGQVSIPVAMAFAAALTVTSLAVSYTLTPLLTVIVVAYLAQNALYSAYLKDVVLVDVLIVAIGFVLRAIAGVVSIDVYLSPWLIVCTFLLALVLAIGKRRHEFEAVDDIGDTRRSLERYSRHELDQLLVITTATLLMAYALYTFFRADQAMMLSLPFAFFGVFRYHHLVHSTDIAGQPENVFTDTPMIINVAVWGVVAVAVIYDVPTWVAEVLL